MVAPKPPKTKAKPSPKKAPSHSQVGSVSKIKKNDDFAAQLAATLKARQVQN